jgi:hypothetical protein
MKSFSNTDLEDKDIIFDHEKRIFYKNDEELLKLPQLPINTDLERSEKIKYFNKLQKSLLLIN